MIKRFVAWLYAIYFTPVPAPAAAESQSSEVKTMSQITLSILTNSQPADGVSADVVQATVTDANGAPVAGGVVNFSAPAGTVNPAQGTTDTNGQVSASLVSSTEGPATLVATLADGTTASVNTLAFVAVPAPVVDPATTAQPTPAQEAKTGVADFEAAYKFVVAGIEQLGASAEDELKALAKKYL